MLLGITNATAWGVLRGSFEEQTGLVKNISLSQQTFLTQGYHFTSVQISVHIKRRWETTSVLLPIKIIEKPEQA